ncbi:MAG: methyltransferase domain-containing protein [Hyphomonadaceae bacterium]|nr:methyltransferase domain-containing protein [Hyphomonadaceae bacterium]
MTDISDCRCIACGGALAADGREASPDDILAERYRCTACGKTYDEVWGVPFFLEYDRDDFTGLVEIAANAGDKSPYTPAGLDYLLDLIAGYHAAADKPAFLAATDATHAPWIPVRYPEFAETERLIGGEPWAGKKVLDVGAGLGFDAYRHVRAGAQVTAVEHSPVLTREGRRTLPMIRWFGGAAHALPFADASFDAVVANAAVHHFRDIPGAMDEMLRVLRPGGVLITTGDPYRADRDGEDVELAVFNAHPDVLLGVNEQIPRFCDIVRTLVDVGDCIDVQIFTQNLVGELTLKGREKIPELREWRFADRTMLANMSGSLAMKIRLKRATGRPARRQKAPGLLRAATVASWMESQSEAMAKLAAWAPPEVVNRPFPGAQPDRFELLNGWQAPTNTQWRQAYRRARWYLKRAAHETAASFEIRASHARRFEFLLNGAKAGEIEVEGDVWRSVDLSLSSLPAEATFALELRMIDPPDGFENGLFQVRRRKLSAKAVAALPIATRMRRRLAHMLYPRNGRDSELERHRALATFGDHSYAGEAGAIRTLVEKLRLKDGYAIDIAASDGVTQSCTLPLFRDGGWRGLAVEYDPNKFAKLAYAYAAFPQVALAKCKVSPENIVALLGAHGSPLEPDFVNLDIDSYDLFVMKAMLEGGYRPKLVSMEINEKLPPPLYFTVLFDEKHVWREDHFFGCSATAASETVKPFGYVLAQLNYNNAMFVEASLAAEAGIDDLPIGAAYASGYRDRADRAIVFPWNRNVDKALDLPPDEAMSFFNEHFRDYAGRYELHISKSA